MSDRPLSRSSSASQSTNQSTNQSINQSNSQSARQHSSSQLISPGNIRSSAIISPTSFQGGESPMNQSINQSINRKSNQKGNQSINPHHISLQIDEGDEGLIHTTESKSSTNDSTNRSVNQSINHDGEKSTSSQRRRRSLQIDTDVHHPSLQSSKSNKMKSHASDDNMIRQSPNPFNQSNNQSTPVLPKSSPFSVDSTSPASMSASPSANQSANHSANHSVNQPIEDDSPSPTPTHPRFTPHLHNNAPVKQPITQSQMSADELVNQIVNPSSSDNKPTGKSGKSRSMNQSINQKSSVFFTRGVSADSVSKRHKKSNHSSNQSSNQSTNQSTNQSVNSPLSHGETTEDEIEPSFSFTPSSVNQSSLSSTSTSSLPSTNTAFGRFMRFIVLKLRSVVNSRTKKILMMSSMVSLIFVIAVIIYFYLGLESIRKDYDWVIHTQDVQVNVEELFVAILNAETSTRGYVITQNPMFLGPYNESIRPDGPASIRYQFDLLFDRVADNPLEMDYRGPLSYLIDQRIEAFQSTIVLTQQGNMTGAISAIIEAGTLVMPSIRYILSNMSMIENNLLAERRENFDTTLFIMSIIMFVVLSCVAVTIVSGLLIGYDWDTRLLKRTNSKLEILLAQAQEGTRLKSLFLANMSHEIRTPMNGVLAMTQLLSSTPLTADQHDIVDTILQSSEAMMRLINDLLLFSKIEAGKFTLVPEWFFLPLFIRPIQDMYTVKAESKGISFSVTCDRAVPRYLFIDSGRLRQVIVNLCDNATKFTHSGHVKLHISFFRRMIPIRDPNLIGVQPPNQSSGVLVTRLHERLRPVESRSSSQDNSANKLSFTPGGTAQLTLRSAQANQAAPQSSNQSGPQTISPSILPPPSPRGSMSRNLTPTSVPNNARLELPVSQNSTSNSSLNLSANQSINQPIQPATPGPQFEDRYYVVFSVTDSGIGISPAAQKYIFEPFSQADMSTTKEYGGTGLGLSISSQLVKAMGGKLKVRSQLGHGSTFEFSVPMTTEELAHALDLQEKDQDYHDEPVYQCENRGMGNQSFDQSINQSNQSSVNSHNDGLNQSPNSILNTLSHSIGSHQSLHPSNTQSINQSINYAATAAALTSMAMLSTGHHLNPIDEADDFPSRSSQHSNNTHYPYNHTQSLNHVRRVATPLNQSNLFLIPGASIPEGRSTEASPLSQSNSTTSYSRSLSVKWHDWFEPEYYSDAEREEQRQIMIRQHLELPPDHFIEVSNSPPSLQRQVQSAPMADQSVEQSVEQNQANSQLRTQAVNQLSTQSINQSINRLNNQSNNQSNNQLNNQTNNQLNNQLNNQSTNQSNNPSDALASSQPNNQPVNESPVQLYVKQRVLDPSLAHSMHPYNSSINQSFNQSISSYGGLPDDLTNSDSMTARRLIDPSSSTSLGGATPDSTLSTLSPFQHHQTISYSNNQTNHQSNNQSINQTTNAQSINQSVPFRANSDGALSSGGLMAVTGSAHRTISVRPGLITAAGPRLRVLVVEDNVVNQKVAKRLLERDGHTVILANHGQEALDIHASDLLGFDVVLMDLAMPVMDGITATKHLRHIEAVNQMKNKSIHHKLPFNQSMNSQAQSHHPTIEEEKHDESHSPSSLRTLPPNHLPIIAVTASALDEDVERCMAAGFDSLIHKPISMPLLAKAMNEIAAAKQARALEQQQHVLTPAISATSSNHSSQSRRQPSQ